MKADDASKVKLEYYSERFAKKLFKRFPQWKQYAGHYETQDEENFVNYLDMSIPSANPSVSEPLRITTYPSKVVTVMWIGGSHTHIGNHPFVPNADYMEQGIEFLEAVVSDQIIFGCYKRDGKSTGGFVYHIAGNFPPEWQRQEHCTTIIRSWLGEHDAEI